MRWMRLFFAIASLTLTACSGGGGDAQEQPARVYPPNDPNAQFGSRESLLFWTSQQQQVGYRNMELIYPTRTISRTAGSPHPTYALASAPVDLSSFRYTYQGASYSLDDYLARNRVVGFLIVKDGRILQERYNFGHSAESKWTSFSVTKSVVSMLIGAAVRDGYLRIDEPVTQYLPQMRSTAYDGVTIRHLLQMSSGARWNEDYTDPASDIARIGSGMRSGGRAALFEFMGALPRAAPPGTSFDYNTGETHLLGALLQIALQQNLSNYLSHKIWSQFAMESDAFWMLSQDNGDEVGGCCISATLRDYGRLGIFAMRNGVLPDGVQVLPGDWMQQSTTSAPTASDYGFLWWLTGSGNFAASGIFGQTIQIYPQENLIIVMQSFWPTGAGPEYSGHRTAVSVALRTALQ